MMETRFQSKEIRIPKPEFDLTSSSPCQYFKSSFARSLSFSSNKTKSLDFGINYGNSNINKFSNCTTNNSGPQSITEEDQIFSNDGNSSSSSSNNDTPGQQNSGIWNNAATTFQQHQQQVSFVLNH